MPSTRPSTRQLLDKIPNYACLYRHRISGEYYGIKKSAGKRKEHSLGTADRKIAERRLKVWLASLESVDRESEKTTLQQLLDKFIASNQGKSAKTRATNQSIINQLARTWWPGLDIRVSDIRPSHLNEWLARHEQPVGLSSRRWGMLL